MKLIFANSGSLLFCPDCGTLLSVPEGDELSVKCEQCEHEEPVSCVYHIIILAHSILSIVAYENIEITTRSHPEAFPSALRQKRKTQTKVHEAGAGRLKVICCRAYVPRVY